MIRHWSSPLGTWKYLPNARVPSIVQPIIRAMETAATKYTKFEERVRVRHDVDLSSAASASGMSFRRTLSLDAAPSVKMAAVSSPKRIPVRRHSLRSSLNFAPPTLVRGMTLRGAPDLPTAESGEL